MEGDTCTQIKPIKEEEWTTFVRRYLVNTWYDNYSLQSKRFLFLEEAEDKVPTDLGKP